MSAAVQMRVDGRVLTAEPGATILEACDAAGRYIPRLCHHPGLGCAACATPGKVNGVSSESAAATECGLCAVESGDGSMPLACATPATTGLEVITDTPRVRELRLERLAAILARHPHVCLNCPDAAGCNRDQCTFGNPPEARCCAEFGRCELGRLVAWVDASLELPRRAVAVRREAVIEGRIRFEAGLCIGCGRCVRACSTLPEAGDALELALGEARGETPIGVVARPRDGSLRASGCTFCGQCVLICPAGAFTAPGEKGAEWLAGRRERSGLASPVLPPADSAGRQPLEPQAVLTTPEQPGVFTLFDRDGRTVLIRGVAHLRDGLREALADAGGTGAVFFELEKGELFTQRESELLARHTQDHGRLPAANDLDDDLF